MKLVIVVKSYTYPNILGECVSPICLTNCNDTRDSVNNCDLVGSLNEGYIKSVKS